MKQRESTFEIPDYIQSRLQPTLTLAHPSREDELAILRYHLPFSDAEMLNLTVEFLQNAHKLKLDFSSRDGINVLRYALKRIAQDPKHPLARTRPGKNPWPSAWAKTPSTSTRSPNEKPANWAAT